MRESQSNADASVGSEATARALAPTDDDAALLTLEVQFEGLITELLAAQEANCDSLIFPDERSPVQDGSQCGIDAESDHETRMKEVEAILARLYPIEQAIIQTPACTVAGLGVKARHAAYVMSQYWEASIDGMDWHARTVRLLIESVCDVAHASLPEGKTCLKRIRDRRTREGE